LPGTEASITVPGNGAAGAWHDRVTFSLSSVHIRNDLAQTFGSHRS
jgi:hypothetical protein